MGKIDIDLYTQDTELTVEDSFLDVDLFTKESELTADEDDIVIEITGLKSINKFIGLDDTPLYYEDGKFFKVEGNKIVYTDVQWSDLKGNVTDNKDLIEQIEINAEKSAKKYVGQVVVNAIDVHNKDVNSHPYLLDTIQENYNTLDSKIDNTKIQLESSISNLDQKLSKDIDDLDIKLSGEIDDLKQDLSDEINNREEADTEIKNTITQLDEKVDGININLTQQIEEVQQDVNDKYNELVRDIDDLTDVVEEDYNTLDAKIGTEIQNRINADTVLQNNINTLSQTVQSNYNTLDTKINTTSQTINQRITDVADELNQTIEDNVVALQQEDTALQNQINTHSQTLTSHNERITANSNAITQEVSDRENADNNLQEQIDGITAGADVRDIVGTYAQLQAYDKSKLGDNDIIKVLNDETKENASTYYRFGFTTQTFTYIGKEGPFYTKSEADTTFVPQTRTINGYDLSENRTLTYSDVNALPDTITKLSDFTDDLGDTPVHTHKQYALETDLSNYGSELDYTDTTLSLLNSDGDTLSTVTIKSTPDLDNKTISLNSNSQLQSIGSILQSGGYQTYWCGTKAEYDAIVTKDSNTLYEVLDEINDIVTEIPTATIDDIGLCKPDGITITIDDTGMISSNNSALLSHNTSNIAHTDLFSAKANINLNNVSSNIDFMIESGIWGNGESGYKKFKSNFLQQWGKVTSSANGVVEFSLHRPYKDMTYSIFAQVGELGNFFVACFPSTNQKFKLRVQTSQSTNIAVRVSWMAIGYTA